jgi:hypothetical protein
MRAISLLLSSWKWLSSYQTILYVTYQFKRRLWTLQPELPRQYIRSKSQHLSLTGKSICQFHNVNSTKTVQDIEWEWTMTKNRAYGRYFKVRVRQWGEDPVVCFRRWLKLEKSMEESVTRLTTKLNTSWYKLRTLHVQQLTCLHFFKWKSCECPPLWSSGQSSWLQIRRPWFDSRHYQKKK